MEAVLVSGNHSFISITGGGGKTSFMSAFGSYLRDKGMRVLITTTTKVMSPRLHKYGQDVIFSDESVLGFLPEKPVLVFYAEKSTMDMKKWLSPREEVLSALYGYYDVIISSSSGIYHTLDESDAPALSGKTLFDLSEPYDIPSSLHPIRLSDMDIPMPERKRIIALLSNEVDRRMDAFECDIEMREEAMAAEDFSYSVMRRLRGVIASLSLSSEKEKSLTDSLYDSIRKAYIERERKIRRR